MIGNYEVITLCGSTKFKEEFEKAQAGLTLMGSIVLSPCVYDESLKLCLDDNKINLLKDIHKRKIDISDSILVINKDDYIGDDTIEEVEYAKRKGKPVTYMYRHKEIKN